MGFLTKQQKREALVDLKSLCQRCIIHPVVNKIIILPVIFLNLIVLDSCISEGPWERSRTPLFETSSEPEEPSFTKSSRLTSNKSTDKDSWWQDENLSPKNPKLKNLIDYKFSHALAETARIRGKRLNSRGYCLRAVKFSLWDTLNDFDRRETESLLDLNKMPCDDSYSGRCLFDAGLSAEKFRNWAKNNPVSLFNELGLADVTAVPNLKIQKGFIFVYAKGQYGFHERHGHIEVVTQLSPLITCSDHCQKRKKRRTPDLILAPIKELPALLALISE